LKDHSRLPFHKIERWTGTHFKSTCLSEMGFILNLGHGGHGCNQNDALQWETETEDEPAEEDDEDEANENEADEDLPQSRREPKLKKVSRLTIVDKEGVFIHKVRWCSCSAQLPKAQQLLQAGLYPASLKQPRTAFTIRVLKYFHLDLMECRTSAFNFYSKLRRMTNELHPDSVPVSSVCYLSPGNS
jgi:CxC2 like cysteine cluster associated with KDZ transposases